MTYDARDMFAATFALENAQLFKKQTEYGLEAGLDVPAVQKEFDKWTKDPVIQKMAEKYESKAALGKFFNHRDPGYQNVDMQLLHKEYDQVKKEMQAPQIV